MKNCPPWLDKFAAMVRPGALASMVGLLVMGGLLFALIELILPGQGEKAAEVFVSFFRAMDDDYYTTIQVMFTAYVFGRSGEKVATSISEARVAKAEVEAEAEAEKDGPVG